MSTARTVRLARWLRWSRTLGRSCRILTLAVVVALAATSAARAGEVSRSEPLVFSHWLDLGTVDGVVTLHRIRVERNPGAAPLKSKIFRPGGGSAYTEDVVIDLDYSNTGKGDWKAKIQVRWLDESGAAIDGYDGTENLDDGSNHDHKTMRLSTLKYGLERAKTLDIKISFQPE